ncbi:hypothetical protein allotria_82 [Salmonella phage allotria]|uniref:Uncharacterized protein n=1 Tax=Salmonella phage allotria TaxID=2713274 RepID=A0A6G8RLZ2_9CAUD|nr:hypothetical protein HYQ31_gp082 [Salmonella phage allotria]QIO02417.1 hypothetical protein allotria_82 [Salmonella phage allotria]
MAIPSFLNFLEESKQLDEAFNSSPYELTFGKKNAGDIFFTFVDEDEKEFRIQFYTPQGLGKNVRQVFIGQKRGSTYPDAIGRFKNPMRVIASMIEATKQFMATPLGKTIDGFAINFSKKALERGVTLLPKIIRQSGLKQKLNVMDLTYTPIPDRAFVWVVRKGKDPAQVFDGPKMQGITWDDPDKVGDIPVQNNDMKPDDIEKIKSDTLFDLLTNKDKNFQRGKDMSAYYYPINDGHISIICVFGNGDLSDQTVVPTYKIKGKVNSGKYIQGDRYNNFESASSGILKTCLSMIPNKVGAGVSSSVDDSNGWKLTSNGDQPMLIWAGKERGRMNTANIAPHYNEPGVYVGAYMNEKSVRGQSADFIARQLKLPQVPISILNDFTTASTKFWKGSQQNSDWNISVMAKSNGIFSSVVKVVGANDVTLSSNDLAIMVKDGAMAKIARTQSIAQVTVFNKEYVGRGEVDRKIMAASDRQGMGWELKSDGKIVAYVEFGIGATAPVDMKTLPKTGSVDDLRNQGYIARILGIVDTYAPQQVGMYAGEKLTRIGAGKYRTSGGLDIQVYFWGIVNSKLSVEVVSDLSGNEQLMLEGDVKNAAFEIVSAISRAADSQFNGEVECRVVPVNGAPYPIQKVSRSQGYSYVDCGSFVLKVSDALLERFTVGKAVELDLMREFPRTTFPVRYDWYGKTELVVKASDGKTIFGSINTNASDGKTIFGSINTNASDKDAVITANLKAPSNGTFFGETVHGFSIRWAVNFPETGKYAGTSMITNVTYYHDKGKVAFTPIISQKGRTLNNPKTYELPLNKDLVQSVIDEISSKMEYLSRNLQQLKSQTYNPNQVFLNDITITDKGEVIWNDYNLSDGKVTQIMLSMISAENKRLEKVINKPDITLPKKQAEVVEFINRMIDIDLGPYLREPKKRDVVLFDSSELSINQLNNIERLGRETGKWSLQPNGGMGHALFLNVW